MMASFCKAAFSVRGEVSITMTDGRHFVSQFPSAVWKWLDGKDWSSVTVYDADFNQSYGWDRI